jgi:hypothetical protein
MLLPLRGVASNKKNYEIPPEDTIRKPSEFSQAEATLT